MKKLLAIAIAFLSIASIINAQNHKVYYKIEYQLSQYSSDTQPIQSGVVLEGNPIIFEPLNDEQKQQILNGLGGNQDLADKFFNTFGLFDGAYMQIDEGALRTDIFMKIEIPNMAVFDNTYLAPRPVFGQQMFTRFDIDVWELPTGYLADDLPATIAANLPPSWDEYPGNYWFQNDKNLTFFQPNTTTFSDYLQKLDLYTGGPMTTEIFTYVYIAANSGFNLNGINVFFSPIGSTSPDFIGFQARHLSKFGGGSGKLSSLTSDSTKLILNPPEGYYNNLLRIKLFYNQQDSIIIKWNQEITATDGFLKIGKKPGIYDYISLPVSGKRMAFIPGNQSKPLTTGRYYGTITNSTYNDLKDISADAQANSGQIQFSNEIDFVIEASATPTVKSPIGTTSDAAPKFEWSAISGVPFYWIFVSSTPFELETLPNGDIVAKGVNTIWGTITDQTSLQYGEVNANSIFSVDASPLIPGNEYNYIVLNAYDDNDGSYISGVFGSVSSFTYEAVHQIDPPTLVAPVDKATFYADETINFRWQPVDEANNYSIYLFRRLTSFAGNEQEIDIPVWNATTNETEIEYPARTTLSKGTYVWSVTANTSSGAGNTSTRNIFDYVIETGEFRLSAKSTANNEALVGFEVRVRAIQGGVSLSNPIVVTNSTSYRDSLVTGLYEFTCAKDGYKDSTFTFEIVKGQLLNAAMALTPLPARISGKVIDQDAAGVASAMVSMTNLTTGKVKTVTANNAGEFSVYITKGTYQVYASKPGYITSSTVTVSAVSEQVYTPDLQMKFDVAYISGAVTNDESSPILLADVTAVQGNVTQKVKTDQNGVFSFTLSSGSWKVSASKSGFISPEPVTYSLSALDNLRDKNIVLTPRANQVSGFVYRVITSANGQVGKIPFEAVTVTATPSIGAPVAVQTDKNGQYSLSLKAGAYDVTVTEQGFSTDRTVQMTLNVAESISGVNFILTPNPSSIAGIVTDPSGQGISGAVISTDAGESATSLPSGSYTMSVSEGTKVISVAKDGYGSPSASEISVSPGQSLTGINFTLSPNAGSIQGRVLSVQQPLTNAVITAVSGSNTQTTSTNSDGEFSISVQPGDWTLSASKSGFITSDSKTITLGPGQKSSNNEFNLTQNIAVIQGSVTSGGSPIKNALIKVTESNGNSSSSTQSNSSGGFSVTVEAGKSYTVSVTKDGYSSHSEDVNSIAVSSKVNIAAELNPLPSSIKGVVYDDSQNPLKDVTIEVVTSGEGKSVLKVVSDYQGEYSLGLSSGSFKITASRAGYKSATIDIDLGLGENLTDINFTLEANFAFLTGSVKDISGSGLTNVRVDLSGADYSATTVSDAGGSYSFTKLIGGTYSVSYSLDKYSDSTIASYTISDGQSKVLDVVMYKNNGTITGALQDVFSAAVTGASVTAADESGNNSTVLSASDGSFSFESVKFGNYKITASKSGFKKSDEVSVAVSPTTPSASAGTLQLTPTDSKLIGKATDQLGDNVIGLQISLSGSDGVGDAVTNTSGEYEVANLSPGKYQIKAVKDGYTEFIDSVTVTKLDTLNLDIIKNSGKIVGTVKNQLGLPLDSKVRVVAGAIEKKLYSTNTSSDGSFTIEEVEGGKTYSIYTDIFKEGYVNDSSSAALAIGQTQTDAVNLTVTVNSSAIQGNTDIGDAAVNVTNQSTNEKVGILNSNLDGTFSMGFLPAGTYIVKPYKEGYIFSPAQATETLTGLDSGFVAFSATKNSGNLTVAANDDAGKALSGVKVTVVSKDEQVVLNAFTGSNGEAAFQEIPVKTYVIRVALDNFTSTQTSVEVDVTAGSSKSAAFTLERNTFNVSGTVYRNKSGNLSAVSGFQVSMNYSGTGRSFSATSAGNGTYKIEGVPKGDVKIFAVKSGYISDTASATLSSSTNVTGQDITVISSSANISGRVTFAGQGLADVPIKATSLTEYETKTNSSGNYFFADLPIGAGANDTTLYSISVEDADLPKMSTVVSIPSSKIGQTVSAETFIIPSGQIVLQFSDGSTLIEGVSVSLTKPDGVTESKTIGANGVFETANNLIKGLYRISVSKDGYLTPDDISTNVTLDSDTAQVVKLIYMPYQFGEIDTINATEAKSVSVTYGKVINDPAVKIYFKRQSASQFTAVELTDDSSGSFTGEIPAQNSTEIIEYYAQVSDTVDNITYTSSTFSIEPTAKGLLNSISINPEINNLILRKGDQYAFDITLRDGLNNSLQDQFVSGGAGDLTIEVKSTDVQADIIFPNSSDKTSAIVQPTAVGDLVIKITAKLSGISLSLTLNATVVDAPLASITLTSPTNLLSNRSSGIQFNSQGVDTTSRKVTLGSNLIWAADPAGIGTISQSGFFVPTDSTFVGEVEISAKDSASGVTGKFQLTLYAEISPSTGLTFTNKKGLSISISAGSVDNPIQLNVGQAVPSSVKRRFTGLSNGLSYTVSNKIYSIEFSSEQALQGDSLLKPADISIDIDESLDLYGGEKLIGYYDSKTKQWVLKNLPNVLAKSQATSSFSKQGEYALITQNEPLGLKYLSVLPNPFSPQIAPLKIGYFLSTQASFAYVTIRVYNIRGELVKTILENDIQAPGKYGGSSSLKEITWDGTTEWNTEARNGRYLISITLKDNEEEKTELIPVVLVK